MLVASEAAARDYGVHIRVALRKQIFRLNYSFFRYYGVYRLSVCDFFDKIGVYISHCGVHVNYARFFISDGRGAMRYIQKKFIRKQRDIERALVGILLLGLSQYLADYTENVAVVHEYIKILIGGKYIFKLDRPSNMLGRSLYSIHPSGNQIWVCWNILLIQKLNLFRNGG